MKQATNSVYRSYFHALYLSRLALAAFWACFVYFLLWSTPWFGIGLSSNDYTPQFLITVIFAGACITLGLLSGTLRTLAHHKREALVAWNSLYDDTTGTHTRSHLYDRLSLECDRSERHGSSFALILLKLRPPDTGHGRQAASETKRFLRHAAGLVLGLTRPSDLVALISANEFAVLVCGVNTEAIDLLVDRLSAALDGGLSDASNNGGAQTEPIVEMGVATYGVHGRTPEALVEAARASVKPRRFDSQYLEPKREIA